MKLQPWNCMELHGIASCMLGTVKILKSSSFCVYRLPFSFVSIIQCLLRVGQGAQQLSSVTKVVISYDWHPHEHCSFVESANDGKVELKKKRHLESIQGCVFKHSAKHVTVNSCENLWCCLIFCLLVGGTDTLQRGTSGC